jgi:hypothetical protein
VPVYGDAMWGRAEIHRAPHAAVSGPPDSGQIGNVEAPAEFHDTVRDLLHDVPT